MNRSGPAGIHAHLLLQRWLENRWIGLVWIAIWIHAYYKERLYHVGVQIIELVPRLTFKFLL